MDHNVFALSIVRVTEGLGVAVVSKLERILFVFVVDDIGWSHREKE